jgi:hypothetical protein
MIIKVATKKDLQGTPKAKLLSILRQLVKNDQKIFPYSNLPKGTGEPTFEDLKTIHRLLNSNAVSVSSYEGGGRHGRLRLIMTNAE